MGSKTRSVGTIIPQLSHCITHRECIQQTIDSVIESLPDPDKLSREERRGIIARYTAVLEGNFIYWMTATYLSLSSSDARRVIEDNLRDEVIQNHPGMLRQFAIAAGAVPTDVDYFAVHQRLDHLRNYIARLRGNELLLMMAFFEGFIARFMPYFARLAVKQGSSDLEYTDVHGVIDMTHTEELLQALEAELHDSMTLGGSPNEGVDLLHRLLESIIRPDRKAGQL